VSLKTLFTFIFVLSATGTAFAQETLTAGSLRTHLYTENRILQSIQGSSNLQAVRDFMQKHLTDNFVFKDSITSHMGSYGSSNENVEYKRADYIDSIMSNADAFSGVKSNLDIKTIDISSDGKRATVVYDMDAHFDAKNEDLAQQGNVSANASFGFQTNSDCRANMLINQENIIQTERLVCKTDASMTLPKGFGE
tara:strand:+ start:2767 stop:3351 length:585 start_codon:yes stop_codon:yes gene_type:complete